VYQDLFKGTAVFGVFKRYIIRYTQHRVANVNVNVGLNLRKLFSAPNSHVRETSLFQIKSAIAKLLVSFRCQVIIREGQAEERTWGYGCTWRWGWTCGGTEVEPGLESL